VAKIFLTGATGFVGANLAPMLAAAGHHLRCLIRPGNPADALADLDFEPVEGTLEDEGTLGDALRGVDVVIHLAALVSFAKGDREAMFRTNTEGTRRLARLARRSGVGRFLHMSTISAVAYSDRPDVLDETAAYNFGPLHIGYCDSKHAAEDAVRDEARSGLDAVIVNPPTMFGPGDRRKSEGSLLEVVSKERVPFLPPGGINAADVRDVCRGCLLALQLGRTGERYILGGQNLTNGELIETIARSAGVTPPRRRLPRWLATALARGATVWEVIHPLRPPVTAQILRLSTRFLWFSSQKAAEELGYAASTCDRAIRDTLAWMDEPSGEASAQN
jgi:dihydroflavonol-4-reductase